MTETNCNVCLTDKTLTFVSVANTTLTPKKFKIEAIGHDRIYACLDSDPSATFVNNVYSTCLTERDPCQNPRMEVKDLKLSGNWTVELEDGTLIENKTLEELSTILLTHEILLEIPPSIVCDGITGLPLSFQISGDLDYEDSRTWKIYVDGEYLGTTGQQFVEEIIEQHPKLTASFGEGLMIENESTDTVGIILVASSITNLAKPVLTIDNPSYSFNAETGTIKFCLSGLSNS